MGRRSTLVATDTFQELDTVVVRRESECFDKRSELLMLWIVVLYSCAMLAGFRFGNDCRWAATNVLKKFYINLF